MYIYLENYMLIHAVLCFSKFIYPLPMLQNPNKNLRFNSAGRGKNNYFSDFQYYLLPESGFSMDLL